jgi:GntR family transcriptional regulator
VRASSRWETIARDLEEQITSGELGPGDRLPSESELSRIYGVSRMTVRQALAWLENGTLVSRVHGSGTFAQEPIRRSGDVLGSFHEELGLRADEVDTRVVATESETPPVVVAGQLALGVNQVAVRFDRIRSVRKRAISFQQAWVPLLIDPGLVRAELIEGSIYKTLQERTGIEIKRATQEVTASAATAEVAAILGCAEGSPLISVARTSYSADGDPVVAAHSWTLPEFSLTYELRR